uniref:DNA recombination protein RmuC n=1 Tax=uncultured Thiotrichaceae bacterium TaxID=298394 RepID=A0A6S6TRK8_9GAMM|nr:MAG: DNA recombination protein RmuC [uncultured Thiotrichaceae bacterium]
MNSSGTGIGTFIDNNLLLIVALLMFLLGVLLSYVVYSRPLQQARREIERLQMQLHNEEQLHEERLLMLDDAQDRLHNTFAVTSQRALRENNQQFMQLAEESMKRFHTESRADLDQRKQSIDHLVGPIKQALEKTGEQIQEIEKHRQASFGALGEQLRNLSVDQMALRQETSKLSTALRTPGTRGQWGEMSLKRIVEMAGMVEHCDFLEQVQRSNEDRTIRPDMVVRMPDKRELVIDAKSPMDAYMNAFATENDAERQGYLLHHAKRVREHVRVLAGKRYWEQFENAPDFVVLFMPGEQFLGAAMEQDKNLMQDALEMRVILSTPATLMALLRAVAFGWQQSVLTENAGKIRDVGTELHKRLTVFINHVDKLGKNLESGVDTYNRLLGSLERSVLPGAKKLSELGVSSGRELADTEPLEVSPRVSVQSELELGGVEMSDDKNENVSVAIEPAMGVVGHNAELKIDQKNQDASDAVSGIRK